MLKAKAAETHGLLGFSVSMLESLMPKFVEADPDIAFEAELLSAAGKATQQVDAIMSSNGRQLPRKCQQNLLDMYLKHLSLFERCGGHLIPKHHLMIHAIQRASALGNPRCYTTYKDENLNGAIAKIAKTTHRATFCESVHRKVSIVQQLGLPQVTH